MSRDRALVAVSAVELACGVLGQSIALRRRHPYDLPILHGSPDRIGRDALMVVGSFGESLVRKRLRRAHWDPVETPLIAIGISSAAAMAALGLSTSRRGR